jgi:UDP-GlcNAc:undecaprenyl-phosphate GlcNAc-1-phosphate transferase
VLLSGVALVSLLMTRQQTGLLLLGLLLAGFLGLQRLGYGEFALIKRGVALRVYDLPMMRRAFFVVFVDIGLVGLALYVSAALKLDSWTLAGHRPIVIQALSVLVPTQVVLLSLFGVYKGSWRLAGVHEFLWLGAAVLSAAALGVLLSAVMGFDLVPPSLYAIYGFVALAVTTASRVSYRALDSIRIRSVETGAPALLYGAGRGGSAAVREMLSNPACGLTPVGFIDDDPIRVGRHVNGYQVMSGINGLEAAIARTGAQAVVVTSLKIPDDRVLQAQRICETAGVKLLRMNIGFEEAMPAGARETAAAAAPGQDLTWDGD